MPSSHRLCGADLETTGFYPNSCAITEIGAVRVREGHIVDQFQQLVNPLRPIPRQITTLTGITDAMVADLDPIDEVLPDSSHGSLPRLPVPPSSRLSAITSASICDSWITTPGISPAAALPARIMTRCRSAAPCSPRSAHHHLADLIVRFGIADNEEHRALSDAIQTQQCFEWMRHYVTEHHESEAIRWKQAPAKNSAEILHQQLVVKR